MEHLNKKDKALQDINIEDVTKKVLVLKAHFILTLVEKKI